MKYEKNTCLFCVADMKVTEDMVQLAKDFTKTNNFTPDDVRIVKLPTSVIVLAKREVDLIC